MEEVREWGRKAWVIICQGNARNTEGKLTNYKFKIDAKTSWKSWNGRENHGFLLVKDVWQAI